MREILFRGKRADTGEWVEGDLLRAKNYLDGTDHCFVFANAEAFPANEFCGYEEVDPSTVGQYTGLLDVNRKKLFEGDIAKFKTFGNSHIGKIVFHQETAGFNLQWSISRGAYREKATRCTNLFASEGIEIIGNIYGNPELLEEESHEADSF